MQFADHIAALDLGDALGRGLVIAGLCLRRSMAVLAKCRAGTIPTDPAPAHCSPSQWDVVVGIARRGLAQAEAAASSHADAKELIDAAEYALNRLIVECAPLVAMPTATRSPARTRDTKPDSIAQLPLAA